MSVSKSSENIISQILDCELEFSSDEVAARATMSDDDARRLWRTLGFPDTEDQDIAYGQPDVDALRIVRGSLNRGLLDELTVLRMTRALGTTMSRLADWQVATLVDRVELDAADQESTSRVDATLALTQNVGPTFESLLVYSWRRHLAAAIVRMEAMTDQDSELLTQTMTVGFVDLVRFTSLSNGLDDAQLANLVERFENDVGDLITSGGGRSIKTLGDAVLFVAPDPETGTDIALRIVKQLGPNNDFPDVRVGLATGSVVSRLGDVFGPPVNLAARLTGVARSNRVIVDHETAAGLSDQFETRTLTARPLRGFGNVEPVTVRRPPPFVSR